MVYIQREIKERFQKIEKVYKIIALVGARQSGKTTFLKENSKTSESGYVLFDDPDAREMFEQDIKKFESQYLNNTLTILDEVQSCKDAGRKLKYLTDSGYKLWITSSSETILSKEVLSYLVGRVSIIRMYPFSLSEFLTANNQNQTTEKILQRMIYEHCIYGGYPKIVLTKDKETKEIILGDLYQTMILKDIARTFSIENINSLESFVKYLSHNLGGLVSYESLQSTLNISFQTVKKYLGAMEKSHLIFSVLPFYRNKLKEISKQPKVYFIDTGLRNYISKEYPSNGKLTGQLFENYVLSELLKSGFSPKYWRTKTKSEVDFIIETPRSNQIIPIEVKLNPDEKITKSLKTFIETYSPNKAIIVNYQGITKKQEYKYKDNKNKEKNKDKSCKIIFTDILGMKKEIIKE
jgi:uncharacterized protein